MSGSVSLRLAFSAALALVVLAPLPVAAQTTGSINPDVTRGPSGLPLPRFVSMASNEVNVRTGPGQDYPIRWTYVRRDLPVKIVEDIDVTIARREFFALVGESGDRKSVV